MLLADGVFLLYKYNEMRQTSGASVAAFKPSNVLNSLQFGNRKDIFKKYRNKDRNLSLKQVNAILNLKDLAKVRSQYTKKGNESVQSVLLLKTHKTGSSTIQNILLRYAILRNLTIALPAFKASFFWPLPFDAEEFVTKQKGITKYDFLVHHSKFHEAEMKIIMKPEAKFITILRDPVSLFKSAFAYYNMHSVRCFNTNIENIMYSPYIDRIQATGRCGSGLPVSNLQAFDLGLSMEKMDTASVDNLIQQLDRVMNIVIITEYFDESLILLRKKFNWELADIVYFKQNAQNGRSTRKASHPRKINKFIARLNGADIQIYKHFKQKFLNELDETFTKDELQSELSALHKLQGNYLDQCVETLAIANSSYFNHLTQNQIYFRPYGSNTLGYVLRNSAKSDINCRLMALPELSITYFLKGVAARPVSFSERKSPNF